MNVKKLLKQQKSAVMPSSSVKRRIAADCGVNEETVINAGGVAVKTNRNKIIVACVCACCCVAATACTIMLLNPTAPSILPDVIESDFGTISSATEFYAYSAVSVGNMLDGTDLTSVASAFALAETYDATSTGSTEITDLQKKTLDKYAVFATGMLGGGKITSSVTAADVEGYEFKLGIGYNDGFGSSAETVLYFNKIADSIKVDGNEEEFAIEGVLVKGDISFPVEGKYETETDGSETESEMEFIAYTSLDKTSYVQIGYEHESETEGTESELVVRVHENGKETEKAKIKGETGEDNSFEVEVERPDKKESVKIKFNPFEENGEKVMYVDAEFNGNKHKLVMQNRPEEQGGGFDFVNRGNGNGQGGFDDEKDEEKDKEQPDHIFPPEFPDFDWDGENPFFPIK